MRNVVVERSLDDLGSVISSLRNLLEKMERLEANLRDALGLKKVKTPLERQTEELYQMLYDLAFEDAPDEHMTQVDMYGLLKANIIMSDDLLHLCESYGWSKTTPNCPLWRGFVLWLIDQGHERFISTDSVRRTRCIQGVLKRKNEDLGKDQIARILAKIPFNTSKDGIERSNKLREDENE